MRNKTDLSRTRQAWRWTLPLMLILVGIALSTTAFMVVRNWDQDKIRAVFEQDAGERYEALKREIESDLHVLDSIKAFYEHGHKIDRSQFRDFVRSFLSRHPGIQALEWIPRIPHSGRKAYEKAARKDGFLHFQITDRKTQGEMVRASQRKEYFPAYFVEPYKGNEMALGFDLGSDQTRLEALEQSRDTGQLVATGRITLVQETVDRFGFLVLQPVYRRGAPVGSVESRRKNLEGFALGVFRIGDILRSSLTYLDPEETIDVYLYDESAPAGERLLSRHLSGAATPPINSEEVNPATPFKYAKTFAVGGRKWRVVCTPSPQYIAARRTSQPWGVLSFGLVLTVLLGNYLRVNLNRTKRVEELIKERTDELQKTNEALSHENVIRMQAEEELQKAYNHLEIRVEKRTEELSAANERLRNEIAERKRAVEIIQTERDKLEMVTQNIGAGLTIISKDHKVVWANNVSMQKFGDVEGKTCYAAFHGRTEICPGCNILEILENRSERATREQRVKDSEGNTVWLEIVTTPVKDKEGNTTDALELVLSITERKRAEGALRESEETIRALLNATTDSVFLIDTEGTFLELNEMTAKRLGKTVKELPGTCVYDLIPPDLARVRKAHFGEAARSGRMVRFEDERQGIWFDNGVYPIRDAQGKVRKLAIYARDVTDRKEAEELFRVLSTFSEIGIYIVQDGKFQHANPYFQGITGYSEEELLEMTPLEIVWPEDRASVKQTAVRMLKGDWLYPNEFRVVKKNGDCLWVMEKLTSINYKGKRAALGNFMEITERKRKEEEVAILQEQLRQSQKMEAIGKLAGGVAHDFNNLLTVIKGYSQLSISDLNEEDPLRENIREIKNAADKASDLTRQLLAFSRRQILEMKVLDINGILENLDKMLRRVIGEDIDLVTVLEEDSGKVKTDPGQMEQVIMNLVVNARDAMPGGGKLTIETAHVELDEEYAGSHVAVRPGSYVMLSVSDTGVGMSPEVKDRVFEPFFTTKERGKGTGLGLSTVYGIVKQSGGNVWVYSELGKGTTVKIYLPRVDEPLSEESLKTSNEESPRGMETVLLVEDDEEVRRLAARILERQGYRLLVASHGEEALSVCRDYMGPIHLVLTDVVMPKMSGREVAKRIEQDHPETKVLYMSGYTDNAITQHGVLNEGMNYIQKPFAVDALSRKVREVLDR